MVAAVLHLGNITFEDNPEDTKGGSRITANSEKAVLFSAKLLSVDPEELRQSLVSKVMQTSRGGIKGTVIMYVRQKKKKEIFLRINLIILFICRNKF